MWRRALKTLPVLLLLWVATTSFVMVDECQFVIVERLGRINAVYDTADSRGLHFKAPWPIDTTRQFDARTQLFDPPGRELFTRDHKNITFDPFVCWRIAGSNDQSTAFEDRPVVRFFRSLSDRAGAEARLDSQLRSMLTAEVGQIELDQLLHVEDSTAGPGREPGELEKLSGRLQQQLGRHTRDDMGLEIVDARIKRINFPVGNQRAVFERMKSERRKIADRYRSAGLAENQVIKSRADRQYNEIMARAQGSAQRIRGEAEAESIRLLSQAHARDPEFYEMMRTLDSYKSILGERTTLVLSASSNLFRLLTKGIPGGSESTPVPKTLDSKSDPIDVTDTTETKP
jgi:membrane protease subunit HflC